MLCDAKLCVVMLSDADLLFTLFSSIFPALTFVILKFVSHFFFYISITSNKMILSQYYFMCQFVNFIL